MNSLDENMLEAVVPKQGDHQGRPYGIDMTQRRPLWTPPFEPIALTASIR